LESFSEFDVFNVKLKIYYQTLVNFNVIDYRKDYRKDDFIKKFQKIQLDT